MKDAHRQQRAPSVARMSGADVGVLDDLPFPDSLPAFDSMIRDRSSGRIWLRQFVVDATPHVWTVLDTDGVWHVQDFAEAWWDALLAALRAAR